MLVIFVANPSMREPAWVALTTMTIIVQSSAQNELSNVNRNDGITKEGMGAIFATPMCCPVNVVIILQASMAHQSIGITMVN